MKKRIGSVNAIISGSVVSVGLAILGMAATATLIVNEKLPIEEARFIIFAILTGASLVGGFQSKRSAKENTMLHVLLSGVTAEILLAVISFVILQGTPSELWMPVIAIAAGHAIPLASCYKKRKKLKLKIKGSR